MAKRLFFSSVVNICRVLFLQLREKIFFPPYGKYFSPVREKVFPRQGKSFPRAGNFTIIQAIS